MQSSKGSSSEIPFRAPATKDGNLGRKRGRLPALVGAPCPLADDGVGAAIHDLHHAMDGDEIIDPGDLALAKQEGTGFELVAASKRGPARAAA